MKLSRLTKPFVLLAGTLLFAPAFAADTTHADNSGNNVADRQQGAITPFRQSNAPADVTVTKNIRRALIRDKSLSMDAHNIKIITTKDHVVYLRGPVATADEAAAIANLAKQNAGDDQINNELIIAK